jgi:flagellar basal body L-ring protein FlgH
MRTFQLVLIAAAAIAAAACSNPAPSSMMDAISTEEDLYPPLEGARYGRQAPARCGQGAKINDIFSDSRARRVGDK